MDEDNDKLFKVLDRGHRRIELLHDEAIVYLGLTRAGKSTAFNWTLNQPMVGKGGRNSYYVNVVSQDPTVAKIGANFGSVTLAPNTFVDYSKTVSLVDMPGFEDSRNYIGTIGVSYFLKVLFERVRKVKFVIVFSEQRFTEETGAGIISTMNGFFELFKMNLMTPEIRKKLIQSMGFLVTRSKEGEYHYEYMKELIEKMKDPTMVAQNKDLIIEFLTQLSSQARIEEFKKAKDSENAEKCTYIERWNTMMKWEYFDLNQIEAQVGQQITGGPFDKDFAKLAEEQKQMLTAAIQGQVLSYNDYSEVLNVFITTFKNNFEEFLKEWRDNQKVKHNYFQMKPLFSRIKEFLAKNDDYGSENIVEVDFKITYEPQTLVKSIEKALKIYDIIEEIGSNEMLGDFHQIMDPFSKKFLEMCDCLRSFASCEEEEKDVERLKFYLKTGFRAFKKLYELHPDSIHDVKQKLPDHLNNVCQEGKKDYFERFINGLNSELLSKALPTLALLEQYETLAERYEIENSSKRPIHFSQIRSNIEIAKADILDREGEKKKALHCYIRALTKQNEIGILIENEGNQTEQQKQPQLDNIFQNKKDLIQKITKILINLSEEEGFQLKISALRLCQKYKMIHEVREIYELILNSTIITPTQKKDMYDNYANFLINWGLFEAAMNLLYKKMSISRLSKEEQTNTKKRIYEIIDQAQTMGDSAKMNVTEWKRVENDTDLEAQLTDILVTVPITN